MGKSALGKAAVFTAGMLGAGFSVAAGYALPFHGNSIKPPTPYAPAARLSKGAWQRLMQDRWVFEGDILQSQITANNGLNGPYHHIGEDFDPRPGDYTVRLANGDSTRCHLRDRLDRRSLFAYEFDDGAARIDLLPRGGGFRGHGFAIRFTYQFGGGHTHRQDCLAHSPYQGILGSLYNELYTGRDDVNAGVYGPRAGRFDHDHPAGPF